MVKIVFCLRRLPNLTAEEFATYWRDQHAELFKQYAKALRVKRYTQSHRIDSDINAALRGGRGTPDGYDGVAQVWFDSLDELIAGVMSAEGRAAGAALIEDEKRFIDLANSPIWLAEELEVELD